MGGYNLKQVKGTGSKKPRAKDTAAGRADCNAVFGGQRLRGQISGFGVGLKVYTSQSTDEYKIF